MTSPEHRGQWLAWLSFLALAAMAVAVAYPWSELAQGTDVTGPYEVRAGQLRDHDVPPEGYMMVVAYGEKELGRWGGAVDLRVARPTRFVATRGKRAWTWEPPPPGPPRINIPGRTPGRHANTTKAQNAQGQSVETWAQQLGARRVVVIVVPYPGETEDGASRTGMGTQGMGEGGDAESASRTADETAKETVTASRQADTRAEAWSDFDELEHGTATTPEREPEHESSESSGAGSGTVGASGENPETRGTGTSDRGNSRGSPLGSEAPSWVDNPRAEIAIRGGHTPADGGRSGGSAGGDQGGEGHVNGAGWLNLLDVPESVAPAVAVAMIVFEADVMGFGQKLFNRTVRRLAREGIAKEAKREVKREIEREVAEQAKSVVERRARQARARMRAARPEAPPVEHIDEIMDYMPEALEVAFYRDLGGLAHQRVGIYRAMIAQTRDATDEVSAYTLTLARENRAAWQHIEEVCEARTRSARAATTKASTGGGTTATANGPTTAAPGTSPVGTSPAPGLSSGAPSSTAPGTSVRAPTAVSTPGHMVAPTRGGLGPVLTGLRGEARVRAVHNIGPRKLIRINGRNRIPDGVTETVLTEVKNVKKQSFTKQLKDYLAIAQERGLRFDLFVRRDAKLSKQLKEALDRKQIHLRYIP